VSWLTDRNLFALAVIVYGVSTIYTVFLWRKGFRQHNRVTYVILAGAFCLHLAAMMKRGFSFSHCPVNNLYEAIIFVGWTIVASYLLLGLWSRLTFLGAFASPILFAIGVFALMPGLDSPHGDQPQFTNGWTSLHAALVLLGYGAFGLSSVAGVMYLTQEHNLKFHKLKAVLSLLPSIERLEIVMGRLLLAGLILFTAGLTVGALRLEGAPRVSYFQDAKVIWSIALWVVYVSLLLMRSIFKQGGRRFAWGAVGTFAFVMLTFWGTNLLSNIHQH